MAVNIYEPFVKSLAMVFSEMVGLEVKLEGNSKSEYEEIQVLGVASVVNFSGRIKGRVLLDMSPNLAISITRKLMAKEYYSESDSMVLATVAEMNNMICGNALAPINNQLGLKLWMSSPYVFTGTDTTICISKIPSVSFVYFTIFGKVKLNLAFEKEA
jgi:chemotaxis protein CheX